MDYSQFLVMRQEIALLVVFLLVFLYDTFMPKGALKGTSWFAVACFAIYTAWCFLFPVTQDVQAFDGMYVTSKVCALIKNVLNVGALIVLVQSTTWSATDEQSQRRGEFYELLLVTLFGM